MMAQPIPEHSDGPPPLESPLICQRCGKGFTEGLREVYVTLTDGTTHWVSTCPDCLAKHPPLQRPPYPDPNQPPQLRRIK